MQDGRKNARNSDGNRFMNRGQQDTRQVRIPEEAVKPIQPILIESCPDDNVRKFLDSETSETEQTEQTSEETEWQTYEEGWNEGYEAGMSEARAIAARVLSRF